jgi:hypothetical protein
MCKIEIADVVLAREDLFLLLLHLFRFVIRQPTFMRSLPSGPAR